MSKEVKTQKKEAQPKTQQQKTKRKTIDKWKKKAWYTLYAPEEFERKELGQTVAEKPELVFGRTLEATASELANQPKKSHIQIKFKVVNVTANKGQCEAIGHNIKDSYLKRIIRRRTSKIMLVKKFETKDKKSVKVKILIVTEKKASGRQKSSILKIAEETTKKFLAQLEAKKVIEQLVFGSLPNKIYSEAKKIYPLKRVEIAGSKLL
ncbi:MAG: hypothetical protein QXZ13_00710 [Candidatus Diapherotrites archaeon]